MKKIVVILLLTIFFLIPISMVTAYENWINLRVCNSTDSCFGEQAFQLTIYRYSGSGNPQQVGKPILLYAPTLLQDVGYETESPVPTSYDSLIGTNWGLTQIIDNGTNGKWSISDANIDNLHDNVNINDHDRSYVNSNGDAVVYSNQGRYYELETCSPTSYSDLSSPSPETGSAGYTKYIFKYQSKARRIVYYGGAVDTSQYYKIYADDNLTEYNIKNNNYLDNQIKNKYFKSVQSIKTYFGIDIDYRYIDEYYIAVEPVQRILGGITKLIDSYLVKRIEHIQKYAATWSSGNWNATEHETCEQCSDSYDLDVGCSGRPGAPTCKKGYTATNHRQGLLGCWVTCVGSKSCNCKKYYTYSLPSQSCGTKQVHEIYGKYAEGYSYLATSRSLISSNNTSNVYLSRAVNYCSNDDNKHCELTSDNSACKTDSNGNIIYQYYIGPNLNEALVGTTSNNYYLLNGSCVSGSTPGRRETGIKHYYLPDIISCENVCSRSISDKTSDAYLQCAENYCDAEVDFNLKGNAQKRKSACILGCKYTYGKDPTPNDGINNSESINSCSNSSPYNNIEKNTVIVDTTSTCSIDKLTGDDLEKTTATIANCVGDQVTDFDNDDTNDTIFDHRTYINVACKESSSTGFYDLTNRKFVAGQGIDYWGKIKGKRECTIYFNLEQWKFDYATISSKDPEKRKRLLYIYEVYNNALDDNYNPKQSAYYLNGFDDEKNAYGEVSWNNFEYDSNKVNINSKVTEIVNNTEKESDTYTLINQREDDSTNSTITGKESIKAIQNMTSNTYTVNRYVQSSDVDVLYTFDKYCVTLDGKAKVYKSPENGVCYENKDGTKIWGRNVFYTNLNATSNKNFSEQIKAQKLNHNISSIVTIGTNEKNENPYYTDGENCPYEIEEDSLSCSIVINNQEGTIMHGNDIYVYGGINATLKIDERLGTDDTVEKYGITRGKTGVINNNKNVEIKILDKKNGIESVDITGIVETKKGVTVQCKKHVYIIDPSSECGVSCSVEKESKLSYEIKSPETGNTIQTQKPIAYYTALSTNMTWKPMLKNIYDNRYIVRLNRELGNKLEGNMLVYDDVIVYGKVEGKMMNTGEKCYNVCWSEPPELPDCKTDYKPSETSKIKEHCELYWDKDINNYQNYEECFNQCSKVTICPDDRRNFEEVEKTCKNNYDTWGFEKASSCINYCYYCPECSDDYIFRQINIYNPFPYSSDSNTLGFNYYTGDRIIPSNWVGKTEYIKQDDEDTTSVTGIHHHENAEYVIELTKAQINAIKENTKEYNDKNEGNNAYIDYVYAEMTREDENGNEVLVETSSEMEAYKSKFIHNTCAKDPSLTGVFKVINGERISN